MPRRPGKPSGSSAHERPPNMRKRATRTTDPLDGKVDFTRFGPIRRNAFAGAGEPGGPSLLALWEMPQLASDAVLLRRGHPGKGKRRTTMARSVRLPEGALEGAGANGSFPAPQPAPGDARRTPRVDPSGELSGVSHRADRGSVAFRQVVEAARCFDQDHPSFLGRAVGERFLDVLPRGGKRRGRMREVREPRDVGQAR